MPVRLTPERFSEVEDGQHEPHLAAGRVSIGVGAVTDEHGNAPAVPNRDGNGTAPSHAPRRARKVGANDPCPCGSGRKFKHCHGAVAAKTLV